MKFADNKNRENIYTFVKRVENDELLNDLNADIQKSNIAFDKSEKKPVHLYKIAATEVKIGENVYDKEGNFKTYRSE